MPGFREPHVAFERIAEIGMRAVADDGAGALAWRAPAQVGDAPLRHDHLHRMLAVVDVRDHGHDGADLPVLGGGGAREDGDVGVAREIARAADAVHHLASHDVRAVDVAENVRLERGVDRDDAETAHDLGMIGDLLRTQHDSFAEEVEVGVDLAQRLAAHRERTAAREGHAAAFHEPHDRVLNHLGVHVEGRDIGVRAEGAEHGVGDIADAGLDGQEGCRDAAGGDLAGEERRHVFADAGW